MFPNRGLRGGPIIGALAVFLAGLASTLLRPARVARPQQSSLPREIVGDITDGNTAEACSALTKMASLCDNPHVMKDAAERRRDKMTVTHMATLAVRPEFCLA
jgi:hypothetical protein